MVAGLLASAGYCMGPDLHPPREANPLGFFEGEVVKEINEDLLDPIVPAGTARTKWGSRWLETIDDSLEVACTPAIGRRISRLTARRPFALKDPRFCYTLPAWRAHLPEGTVFVCVFREPGRTVNSILKECRDAPWLLDIAMSPADAESLWIAMYRHVLNSHRNDGDWLFLHYDQVLDGAGVAELANHLCAALDPTSVQPSLKRSADGSVGRRAKGTYNELCALAGFVA